MALILGLFLCRGLDRKIGFSKRHVVHSGIGNHLLLVAMSVDKFPNLRLSKSWLVDHSNFLCDNFFIFLLFATKIGNGNHNFRIEMKKKQNGAYKLL